MKNTSAASLPRTRRSGTPALHCNIVVEPSSIDFLNEGAVFVAGSVNDCGTISPLPEPQKSKRRGPSASRR